MNGFFLLAHAHSPTSYLGLRALFDRDRAAGGEDVLLRSGDLYDLDPDEVADLEDGTRTVTILAIDVASGDVIGHVSMHRKTTIARGTTAHVELMVVDPRFRGLGVSRPLLVSAIRRAAKDWNTVRAVTLTSEPQRERARALYTALGFVPRNGNEFKLMLDKYPWRPAGGEVGVDAVTVFTPGGHIGQLRNAAIQLALHRVCTVNDAEDVHVRLPDPCTCRARWDRARAPARSHRALQVQGSRVTTNDETRRAGMHGGSAVFSNDISFHD